MQRSYKPLNNHQQKDKPIHDGEKPAMSEGAIGEV